MNKVSESSATGGKGSTDIDGSEGPFSVIQLLTMFAKRKWYLLCALLLGAFLLGALSFLFPPTYTAIISLVPPQQSSGSTGSALMSQLGNLGALGSLGSGSLGLKNPVDQDIYLMETNTVQNAVILRFHLLDQFHTKLLVDARTRLKKLVKIHADTKAGVIELSVEDRDPRRAAELANGYIEEYQKQSANLAVTEAAQRRLFFGQQLETEKDKLAAAEEDLKRTEQTTGVVEISSQARALIQSVSQLRAQVIAKEVQVSSMETYAASNNPDLVQAKQELSSLRAQLANLSDSESRSSDLLVSKGKLPEVELANVRRLREVKYHEVLFEMLARQYEIAKLDEAREGVIVQVVDPATVPERKSFPTHSYFVLGGALAGLFLGTISVALQAGLGSDEETPKRLANLWHALLQGPGFKT